MSRIDKILGDFFDKYRITVSVVNCWKDYEQVKGIYFLPYISLTIDKSKKKYKTKRYWFGWIIWHVIIRTERVDQKNNLTGEDL